LFHLQASAALMAEVTFIKFRTPEKQELSVKGRDAWTLHRLYEAGDKGCTPLEYPAPRWSAYVFKLRKLGLIIQTVRERHGGSFSGEHGRYVLLTPLEVLDLVCG